MLKHHFIVDLVEYGDLLVLRDFRMDTISSSEISASKGLDESDSLAVATNLFVWRMFLK